MLSTEIIIIAHNIRSTHNVGSILRTADGLGVYRVYFTGYTPYPSVDNDDRLPHIAQKITKKISKTALGAEQNEFWQPKNDIADLINDLKKDKWVVTALEQNSQSIILPIYKVPKKIALVIGNEVNGIDSFVLNLCDEIVEIPMLGIKESFNVVEAATMAIYNFRYFDNS